MNKFDFLLKRALVTALIFSLLAITFNKDGVVYEDIIFMAIVGGILGLSSGVYDIKIIEMKYKMIIHYLIMLTTVFPIYIIYSMDSTLIFYEVFIRFLKFNLIGIILFTFNYLIISKNIKNDNMKY